MYSENEMAFTIKYKYQSEMEIKTVCSGGIRL